MTECKCIWCADCAGSGQVRVPTNSYPEWDLESCMACYGTGIAEQCRYCADLEEEHDGINPPKEEARP